MLGAHWPALVAPPRRDDKCSVEQRLERALAAAGAVAWEWDIATAECRLSAGATELLTLKDDPAEGFFTLVHPADRGWLRTAVADAVDGKRPYDFEFRLLRPDGRVEWVRDSGQLEYGADGQPMRLAGVAQVSTAHKRVQDAFAATFEQAAVGMAHVSPSGSFLAVNDTLCRILGRPREALMAVTFQDLTHPDDLRADLAQVEALLAGGIATYSMEKRYLLPDGGTFWANLTVSLVRDLDGAPDYFISVVEDISARKAMLALDQALVRGLMEGGPNCIKVLDAAGRLAQVNDQGLRALEIEDFETIRGLPFEELWPEAERDHVRRAVAEAGTGGKARFQAYGPTAKDGPRWWAVAVWPLPDGDGRLLAVSHDVTDARLAALALADSETKYRSIFNSTCDFMGLLRPDGTVLELNQTALRLCGLTDADVHGRSFCDMDWWKAAPDPALAARVRAAVAEAAAGRCVRFEAVIAATDGRVATVDFSIRPILDPAGAVLWLAPEGRDITTIRRAETALAESEAMFRSLADSMPQTAFVALPDGRNEFQNRRWFEYTGQVQSQSAGSGWAEVLHPDDLQPTLAAWAQALATATAYSIEHRLRGADGAYRWFLTRAEPLHGPGGEILRWFGTCTDVSEIVAAREAAARSAAELEALVAERTRALSDAARELAAEMRRREEAQAALLQSRKLEALGQLTGGVAHDFNNVLSAIIGSYALIRRRTTVPDILGIVGHGEQAAERAAKLIRQLMAFARKEDLCPAALAPAELLRGTEDLLCHAVGEQIRCVLDAPDGLWPVLADQHQLEIALLNLAVNARAAMPDGGTLTVAARNLDAGERPAKLPAGGYVSISVCDTGMGMPPEVAARAAEPFFTTKARGEGTGLGLSMVHGFAAQSGGTMRIESQLGAGTLVEIILPRAALTEVAAGSGLGDGVLDSALHGNAVILLVEDDPQVRPMTAGFLRELGYDVMEAASAEAASALVHTLDSLDLVITDVVMPGADGPTLASRLRAERPALPVLFATGHVPGPGLTGEAVLNKPFSGAQLAAAVLERLGRRTVASAALTSEDRLLARLRTPSLRELFLVWCAARQGGVPPPPNSLDPDPFGVGDNSFVVEVDPAKSPAEMRYVRVGAALTARLGRSLIGEVIVEDRGGDEVLGSLTAVYGRCARQRMPVYQSARYDFGDGAPVTFERLILPLSADGAAITQLVGVALFDGHTP